MFDALGIVEVHGDDSVLVHGDLNDADFVDDHGKVNPSWYKKVWLLYLKTT